MECKIPSLEQVQTSFPGIFQNLKELNFTQICKQLGGMTNTIIENYPLTRNWLKILGEGSETRVQAALFRSDFTHIHEVKGEFTPVLQVSSLRNQLKNMLLEYAIEHGKTHLKTYEKEIISAFTELCTVFGDVFIRWRENIRSSELGKHVSWLEEEEAGSGAVYLLKNNLANPFSVFEKNANGEWEQKAMVAAYPEQYKIINRVLLELLRKLKKHADKELSGLIKYFQLLNQACQEKNIERAADEWLAVERAWLDVDSRLQPVHAMEYTYIDPVGIRVSPGFQLLIDDEDLPHLNAHSEKTKKEIWEYLEARFQEKTCWHESKPVIEKTLIKVCVPVLTCGAEMEFHTVGQILPNREETTRNYGVKIFLDHESMSKRRQKTVGLMRKIFGSETTEKYFTMSTGKIISQFIAGHESGHGAFMTSDIEKRITPSVYANIEEAKATWVATAATQTRLDRKQIDEETYQQLAVLLIGSDLRYLSLRNEMTLRPYYNSAVIELNAMFACGLIEQRADSGRWIIFPEKIPDFYELMEHYLEKIVDIYEEKDISKAMALLNEVEETEKIDNLYNALQN